MASKRSRLTSSLEDDVAAKVSAVISSPDAVAKIVAHLVSDEVGVTCLEDLKHLTKDMLPVSVVAPIKAVQLLAHFKTTSSSEDSGAGPSRRPDTEMPPPTNRPASGNRATIVSQATGFSFAVPWSTLPKLTLDNLTVNEMKHERAKQEDINELKLSIVKKLVSSYKSYKEQHPGQKKHPGMKIYESITNQCFDKYQYALTDEVNGKQVGDGKASFLRAILICTENMMRQKSSNSKATSSKAVQARGTIGVLPDQYLPVIALNERRSMEEIRSELQSIHKETWDWDWEDIKEKQMASYSLQREDIMNALDKINEQQEKDNNDENTDEPDEPEVKAVTELLQLWPFLFKTSGLKWHHDKLTDRPLLAEHLNEFVDSHLDNLCLYLMSSSKENTANVAINTQLEKRVRNWTPGKRMMKGLYMLANHFSEKIDVLLHTVEKTTPAEEITTKSLRDLCIIAQDKHPFAAETFHIITDEVIISEANSFTEAMTSLMYAAFILDLEYPKMPSVFEFVERFIYGLGIPDTRVKNKKGKQILVLTPAVRDLINGLQKFEEEIDKVKLFDD